MNSMILATGGISIAINLLLVILVAVCLLLCLVVLMQRPKQEGLGAAFGGGMTDQAFGARTTDVLQKGTVYLGTSFFILTISLSLLVSAQNSSENADVQVGSEAATQVADAETVEEVAAINEEVSEPVATEEVVVEEIVTPEAVETIVEEVVVPVEVDAVVEEVKTLPIPEATPAE